MRTYSKLTLRRSSKTLAQKDFLPPASFAPGRRGGIQASGFSDSGVKGGMMDSLKVQTQLRIARPSAALSMWDMALLARLPLDARRILYLGPAATAFAEACRARNPAAEAAGEGGADAAAVLNLQPDEVAGVVERLAAGGVLAASCRVDELGAIQQAADWLDFRVYRLASYRAGFDDLAASLAPDDLANEAATKVILVARKRDPATVPVEPLILQVVAFATEFMEIRTRLPAQALQADPDLRVVYCENGADLAAAAPDVPKVLVVQRPGGLGPEFWVDLMARAIREGWVVVMEFDDHPELVAEANKFKLREEHWGQFSWVHAIQTSTEPLVELFRRRNPEVKLFANAAFNRAPFPETPPDRIFYGAVARGDIAVKVARAMGEVAAQAPDAEFIVVGDMKVFEALPAERKRFYDFMPYGAYLELMGTCAISLTPIEARGHEDTKSDAKFLDASSRGLLTIASPTIYKRTIVHGETGLIAERIEDWPALLGKALAEPKWARSIARNAWTYVGAKRMFAQQGPERARWYRELWERREALNAALVQRLPGLAAALKA